MTAYRIEINQGETFSLAVQWLSGDVATDLTGASVKMQIRASVGSTVLQTFSNTTSGLTIDVATGTITLDVSATVSAAWTFTHALYDILVTLPSGVTKRLLEGDIYVSQQVTV